MSPYLHAMRYWFSEYCKLKRNIKKWKKNKSEKFQQKHNVFEKIKDNTRIMQQSIDTLTTLEADQSGKYICTLNLAILQCELVELRDRVDTGLSIHW